MARMDVVGLGALNYDLLFFVDKLAARGTHQPIIEIYGSPGGSAANTICSMAKSGFRTGFIGAVGNDSEGVLMLSGFKKLGVDCSRVKVVQERTGMIVGFVEKTGERTMYVHPGANNRLTINREDIKFAKRAKLLHMSSFVGVEQFNEQKKIADGKRISFSPGFLYSRLGIEKMEPMLERSRVVFLNSDELKLLTGKDYKKGSRILLDRGAEIVVITLGKRGCYVTDGRIGRNITAYKTQVVDTTGAGDAFCAGFLAGLLDEKGLEECGRMGNKMASRCIKKFGARL